MAVNRNPQIYHPRATSPDDPARLVQIPVCYRGLKGEPVDDIELTPAEAVVLATQILKAALIAQGEGRWI
jgi:hypothetical protein